MNAKLKQYVEQSNISNESLITIRFHNDGLVPKKTIVNRAVKEGYFTYTNGKLKPTELCNSFVLNLIELAKAEGEV